MYSFKSRVRYSEIGHNQKMSLNAIINYFQDCSTFQSEELGLSMNYFYEKKRVWLLSSWQIIVNEYPRLNDEITISTWAYDFKGLYGYRNFMIQNNKAEKLAYANSVWVYIDTETGLPTRITNDIVERYGLEDKLDMDYASRKITIPETLESFDPYPVVRANIDTNHHVNNGQYVLMGEHFLPENYNVRQMRADYRKAAKLGDLITPKVAMVGDVSSVALADTNGKAFTTIKFKQ